MWFLGQYVLELQKDQSGRIKSTNNFVNDCTLYDMRDIQQSSLILDSFQFLLKSDHTMLLRYMIVKPQSGVASLLEFLAI